MFSQFTIVIRVTHILDSHYAYLSVSVYTESWIVPCYPHRYKKSAIVFSGRHIQSRGMVYLSFDAPFLIITDVLRFLLVIQRCFSAKISIALCQNGVWSWIHRILFVLSDWWHIQNWL